MVRDLPNLKWAERHGLTTAELRKELDAGRSRGYHPIVISGYRQGVESRYLAVWVQDTPTDPPTTWTPADPEAGEQGALPGRAGRPVGGADNPRTPPPPHSCRMDAPGSRRRRSLRRRPDGMQPSPRRRWGFPGDG